jgi:hypothetical protein
MSQENVEIVRKAFEALAARGVEAVLEFVARRASVVRERFS